MELGDFGVQYDCWENFRSVLGVEVQAAVLTSCTHYTPTKSGANLGKSCQ